MSASSNRVAPNTADEESCKMQLVQVETADGSIPDADSLNSKVLQVEAADGRILSDDGVAVMETPGSGENRSDLFIAKTLQLKNAAEIPSRADTWSSLFSHQAKMPGFFQIVKEAWDSDVSGTPLFIVVPDEESRKTQLVQVETADGSIPDADSLNSKVLQVEAAGGRILSDDGVAVMETPGSGENRSDLFIPKTLQLKDAA
ncbi:hypothetical protein MRB53_010188 [Persea americana]|uniref:Uncharacterized protein n=1 Tax=Persea americana TaxID=3435 RepID=A0ACC2LR19_PERAE|nr:hypothetical protein MRB53_010188 [Persea americana]